MTGTDIPGHWAKQDIYALIRETAERAGISPESLIPETLAPLDHFQTRGLASTEDLADRLPIAPGQRLLDIGCGVGGSAPSDRKGDLVWWI